jgi:hypothetical protein
LNQFQAVLAAAKDGAGSVGQMSSRRSKLGAAVGNTPMIAYLVRRSIDPEIFVKYMAILALTASSCLLLALGGRGTMSPSDLLMSAGLHQNRGVPHRGALCPRLWRS